MEVVIDQENVTPQQQLDLESYGIQLCKRDPHPRRGSYKWGYYIMDSSVAERFNIPEKYWSVRAL